MGARWIAIHDDPRRIAVPVCGHEGCDREATFRLTRDHQCMCSEHAAVEEADYERWLDSAKALGRANAAPEADGGKGGER